MNARAAETVQPIVVALVPVVSDRRGAGLLLVAPDDSDSAVALPCTHVEITDVTWQEALVRALRDKGLDVTFDTHVRTASGPGGQMLIFGQTHPVHEHRATVLDQPLRIMRAEEEAQRDAVLARAREMLAGGRDPAEALDYLANTLTGKLLHTPSVRLREAAQSGDSALLEAAARLFGDGEHQR